MKIKAIDIAAFGKFKNYHLDIPDGMTVIFGENENGKTTIMAFIRMMFYGNTGKASGIDKNPRKKYRPWNSDIMAGSVTFTHEGRLYRLEREFKASNSADKISLIDLDTGEKQTLSGSDDIGARFFGLTDGAFERSVFLSETGAPAKNEGADGEINARLSNIAATGDEDISFEKVSLRLRQAKEALFSKSRKVGKCDKAITKLEALDARIRLAKEKEAEIEALQQKVSAKEKELKAASDETSRLFELLKNADKVKKRIFVERYISAEKEKQRAEQQLGLKDGGIADISFINEAKELLETAARSFEKCKTLEKELESTRAEAEKLQISLESDEVSSKPDIHSRLSDSIKELDAQIEKAREESDRLNTELETLTPTKKVNLLPIIIGGVIALLGAVCLVFSPYVALAAIAAGIITALMGFVFKKTVMPFDQALRERIAENSRFITSLLDRKQAILDRINEEELQMNTRRVRQASTKALLDSKLAEVGKKTAELSAEKETFDAARARLSDHLSRLSAPGEGLSSKELIARTEEALRHCDGIKQRLGILADHANCSSLSEAEQKLAAYSADGITDSISEQDIDGIKEKFRAQSDISGKMRSELASLKAQIKAIADSVEPVAVLAREREELSGRIDGYKAFSAAADLAGEALEESFRELRKNYSGALEGRTAEIFAALTGDKYHGVSVSKSFELNITTDEAFGLKEAAYLSSGTEDQLYLALRLAISELMTEDGSSLPMFMDDPLAQYDDGRAELAIRFLKEYSADRQTVMFTCHKAFGDMAQKLSIKVINL